jgi:hypothetical protein
MADRTWATSAQLLDRFWVLTGEAPRTGFATLDRLVAQGLLQRHPLDPAQGRRTQHVYGLTTRGRRLLGLGGRARAFRRGTGMDLVLQTTEVYVELEAEGWEVIPAGARWAQHRALKRAQEAAIRRAEVQRSDVINPKQASVVSVGWLPMMDLLFHPAKEEARYVMVLTRAVTKASRKGLLSLPVAKRKPEQERQNMWMVLKTLRPITIEIVTTDHFPRRLATFAQQARRELRLYPDRVRLEQVERFSIRSSPGQDATATGRNVYEELGVPDPRFK